MASHFGKTMYARPTVREIIIHDDHVYGLRIWNAYQEEFILDYLEERCVKHGMSRNFIALTIRLSCSSFFY
jgi:hypothetical protein